MDELAAVRAAYTAFEQRDLDGALASVSPDVVWEQAEGLSHGGIYHGLNAVREHVFGPLTRDWWEAFSAPPSEFIAAAPHVVVLGRYRGRAKVTGAELDVPFVHIWTFEDGWTVRFRQFLDTFGWNNALGSHVPPAPASHPN